MPRILALKFGSVLLIASILVGCGTSRPASVAVLSQVYGDELPGAMGKTVDDQNKIDLTVAGGCSVDLYTRQKCRTHTQASAERRKELSGGS